MSGHAQVPTACEMRAPVPPPERAAVAAALAVERPRRVHLPLEPTFPKRMLVAGVQRPTQWEVAEDP
eukprot:scaffold354_cov116-Isochrysis_galbana.AAC.9